MTSHQRYSDSEISKSLSSRFNKKRTSLVTVFSSAVLAILVLFIVINSVVAVRFSDFQSILSQLSDTVLPKATLSGQAFSKVNQLTYLTARLSNSPSQAFRLIAFRDIKEKIKEIADLKLIANKDQILKTQLESIVSEFDGLNLLIEERIQYQKQVKSQEEKMYKLHAHVMEASMNIVLRKNSTHFFSWLMNFSRIVALSSKSLAVNRLNQVRQINAEIKQNFDTLKIRITSLSADNKTEFSNLTKHLKSLLILDGGLLPTRILELRSVGRTIGRSNFVHNLVEDFARQVQFESRELNEVVIADAKATTNRIKTESELIKLMTILTFIFLFGVAFFLHRKIIKRLIELDSSVLSKIKGKSLELNLGGNDEISDIAKSFNLLIREIEEQKFKLKELSLTDGLTGIANRRCLDTHLTNEVNHAIKNKVPLSVLMMDVDCFKNFNDHYGHLAGDDCLKQIAQVFKESVKREDDFIARFGGEEFVLILPDTGEDGAETIANEVLRSISSTKIIHEWNSASPYISLSIGCASFDPQEPISDEELLKRADRALYQAKENGRNCFAMFDAS